MDKAAAQALRQRSDAYAQKIRRVFAATVNELLSLNRSLPQLGEGEMFSFEMLSAKQRTGAERLFMKLHSVVKLAIEQGISLEWDNANKEADSLVWSLFGKKGSSTKAKLPDYIGVWMQHNNIAMQAFLKRSEKGMNLSNRVWKPINQLRDEMEVAITIAIGEGQSAAQMSRIVRKYLNDPDLMFRRFRYKDKDTGEWKRKWKKKIRTPDGKVRWIDYDKNSYQDEYTGKGYYKSAAKNAMRMTRTETNMAYRNADNIRWSQLDFVLGQRIWLSNKHPEVDICDKLKGDYPKEFIFEGWHPHCFCYATPILADREERRKMEDAMIAGKPYVSPNKITKYPEGFTKWIDENKGKINASIANGTAPYFIAHNQGIVKGMMEVHRADFSDIEDKIMQTTAPREKNLYVSFEPFSPIIMEKLKSIKDKRQKNDLFESILNDGRAEVLNVSKNAKTTRHPTNRGNKSQSWKQTKQMAVDLNESGRSVSFLPEFMDATSADAIVQFKDRWDVVDFKHSTSTKANTIEGDLSKGFIQANTIVIKVENADLGIFRDAIEQMKRKSSNYGNIILINKYGKVKELERIRIKNNKYLKDIKGFL